MAASAAAALLGVAGDEIEDALSHFQGLPHALEKVAEVDGVRFYNDSKATNVQAVGAALESFDGGILLILGGRFKGGDLRQLRDLVARKVKRVFAIGESRDMVRDALEGTAPIEMAKDLESAVEASPPECFTRRRGAALARGLELRHVPRLSRTRGTIPGGGREARRGEGVRGGFEALSRPDALHRGHRHRGLRRRHALQRVVGRGPRVASEPLFLRREAGHVGGVGRPRDDGAGPDRLSKVETSGGGLRASGRDVPAAGRRPLQSATQQCPPLDSAGSGLIPAFGAREDRARFDARPPARPQERTSRGLLVRAGSRRFW